MKALYNKLQQIGQEIEEAFKLAETDAEKAKLRKAWAEIMDLKAQEIGQK
jgi:hypothetical protein